MILCIIPNFGVNHTCCCFVLMCRSSLCTIQLFCCKKYLCRFIIQTQCWGRSSGNRRQHSCNLWHPHSLSWCSRHKRLSETCWHWGTERHQRRCWKHLHSNCNQPIIVKHKTMDWAACSLWSEMRIKHMIFSLFTRFNLTVAQAIITTTLSISRQSI